MKYKISEQFTITPGARYKNMSKYSAEEFRDDILRDLIINAIENNDPLILDLDDTYGYAASFIDEVFTPLKKEFGYDVLKKYLILISNDDKNLINKIFDKN